MCEAITFLMKSAVREKSMGFITVLKRLKVYRCSSGSVRLYCVFKGKLVNTFTMTLSVFCTFILFVLPCEHLLIST